MQYDPAFTRMQAESAVASARTALLVIGVIGIIGLAISFGPLVAQNGLEIFQIPLVLWALLLDAGVVAAYFVCRAAAIRKPGAAITAALILFLATWVINIALGTPPHSGILIRVIVLVVLVKALVALKRAGALGKADPSVFE